MRKSGSESVRESKRERERERERECVCVCVYGDTHVNQMQR